MWNHTAGTLGRSMRSTHGVLVEHQRVLVTVESPRRAYQAVQRMTRSKTQRELWQVNAEHRDMSFNARGLYRLWPGGQSAGFLMRFSFLHTRTLEADDRPPPNFFCVFSASPGAACPKSPRAARAKKKLQVPLVCARMLPHPRSPDRRDATPRGSSTSPAMLAQKGRAPPPHTHPSIKKALQTQQAHSDTKTTTSKTTPEIALRRPQGDALGSQSQYSQPQQAVPPPAMPP